MKIGICALGAISQDSGGRTYLINFIRTCVAEKSPHEFFIFYSGPNEDLWGDLPANFHKIIIPGTSQSSWRKVLGEQLLLPFWIIGRHLDVLYFPGNFLSPFVCLPKVVAVRSTLYYHFPKEVPAFQRWHRKALSWVSVRLADRILVPSESIAADVVRFMGADPGKIVVVAHGVDTTKFSNRPAAPIITQRVQEMGVHQPYFLFVSALWHYKGAHCFLEALAALRQQPGCQNIQGVMAGQGLRSDKFSRQLVKTVHEAGLEDVVRFVGHRSHDEIAYLYWGTAALVFPSYYESFGNPLVEAMAAGTPIVASNRHAVPATVGPAAVVVDPDDPAAMVTAMRRVLEDAGLQQQLTAAGRDRVQRFQWPKSVAGALDLCRQATNPRLLLFGYLPPPHFGPSISYQALLRSRFAKEFRITFLDLSVVTEVHQLEQISLGKFGRIIRVFGRELYHLASRKFDFCCCPISVNRNAFLKDAALVFVARLFRVPYVCYAHGNNLPDFRARAPRWVQRIYDWTVRGAAGAIVLGENLRFNFQDHLPPEKIFVVPHGIEPTPRPPVARPARSPITVLYLSALVAQKGLFQVLEAAAQLRKLGRPIRFVFGGDWVNDEVRQQALQFVAAHDLGDTVEFAGRLTGEPKQAALENANIFVFPTFYYYETFGMVLLEALQAGLPVITTRRAAIPEIIQDGINGLFVAEENATELAAAIDRLAADPQLRDQMSHANRARFQQQYTHEHYGERMSAVFHTLAARRRASHPA